MLIFLFYFFINQWEETDNVEKQRKKNDENQKEREKSHTNFHIKMNYYNTLNGIFCFVHCKFFLSFSVAHFVSTFIFATFDFFFPFIRFQANKSKFFFYFAFNIFYSHPKKKHTNFFLTSYAHITNYFVIKKSILMINIFFWIWFFYYCCRRGYKLL